MPLFDVVDRIEALTSEIWEYAFADVNLLDPDVDLVVIEAPSFGSTGGKGHERAGLWWDVAKMVRSLGIPVATVAPTSRAKYITGNGRAKKPEVLAAGRATYSHLLADEQTIPTDNTADAIGLMAMGMRFKGFPIETSLPAANLEPMKKVKIA